MARLEEYLVLVQAKACVQVRFSVPHVRRLRTEIQVQGIGHL